MAKKREKTNPNGANQYLLDPRQKICWDLYITPGTEFFSNATQSAIKAGYEKKTARQITTEKWFIERVRRLNMLGKAERVLDEMLEMPVEVKKIDRNKRPLSVADEEDEEIMEEVEYLEVEPALVKIKQDTAKFVAERLGKNEGYSQRTETTGKDGKDLPPQSITIKYIVPEAPKKDGNNSESNLETTSGVADSGGQGDK